MLPAAIQSAHSSMQHHQTKTHQRSSSKPVKELSSVKHLLLEQQQALPYNQRYTPRSNLVYYPQSYPASSTIIPSSSSSVFTPRELFSSISSLLPKFSLATLLTPRCLMLLVILSAIAALTLPMPEPEVHLKVSPVRRDSIGTAEHVYRYHVEHHPRADTLHTPEPTDQLVENFVPLEESEDAAEPYIIQNLSQEDTEWGQTVVRDGGKLRFAGSSIPSSSSSDIDDTPSST